MVEQDASDKKSQSNNNVAPAQVVEDISYHSGQETREEEEDTQAWWGLLKLLILCHTSENKEVITQRIKDNNKNARELSFD